MVCAQVLGGDVAINIGGQAGVFQLNVMLPMIAHNLLQSIECLGNGARVLADKAIEGFGLNEEKVVNLVRNAFFPNVALSIVGIPSKSLIS